MKKLLCMIFASALLVGSIGIGRPSAVFAVTDGDYTYIVQNDEAILTKYSGSASHVTIPSTLGGYRVAAVGDYAFYNNPTLTEVTLPYGVDRVEYCAFWCCSALEAVSLPNSITTIESNAFANTALEALALPASVTSVAPRAFASCTALTSITIDSANSVYHTDNNCLIETAANTLVVGCQTSLIPADGSVTAIGDSAFEGQSAITDIIIPVEVTIIGFLAFNMVPLKAIYYTGSHEQWQAIQIGNANDSLLSTTVYYDYVPSPEQPPAGDLNGDEERDMRDAFLLYSAVSGGSALTESQSTIADMNGDGDLDMRDAFALYKIASGE